MRICYHPSGDGLDALTALFVPSSPVDRERLGSETAPAGWCSWYELFGNVSEPDVVANLEFCAANFDRRFFRYIQLDDGYQKATGDWDTNAKFPHGHRWLTDQIHAKGFKAGLWVAPFAVTERSGIPAAHPDWLLRRPAAARGRLRERDAHRHGCGRELGRHPGAGPGGRAPQLLSPGRLAERSRLPPGATAPHRRRSAGVERDRGALRRRDRLLGQPAQASARPAGAAAT